MKDNQYPYLPGNRFVEPDSQKQVFNPYDQDSRLFTDLAQRGIRPVKVVTINLGTAGTLSIPDSGYHFVAYGFEFETPPNTPGNKPVNTSILVNVQINTDQDRGYDVFPAKHARGFSGPFQGLFLQWPQQQNMGQNIYCDFIIYKSFEKPWVDGEAPT